MPPADRWFTSEHQLGLVASGLIGLVVVGRVVQTVADWRAYGATQRQDSGTTRVGGEVAVAGPQAGDVFALAYFLVSVAAVVVFIVWLWRVRWNSELFCAAEHRRARGWVVAGWFCPGVSLWFPKQIVDDVLIASDPRTPPLLSRLEGIPGSGLVLGWWLTTLAAVVTQVATAPFLILAPTPDDLSMIATFATVTTLLTAVSAALVTRIIQQVDIRQTTRPWTAWWDN